MDKIKLESSNIADENFEKLASLFPNVVTETIVNDRVERAIDVEKLKQEINAHILSENEERYNFTWPDKRKSVVLANAPTRNTLRACKEESKDFDNTENLYIEGDNLEVLKLLRNTYMGKVKMIYIDPPYNTGKDFVYQDNFYINKEEYKEMSGQFDEEGNRLFENTEANGRFHTDWLNMMYPRLKMARDLLSDDGVIFISIDDNEVSNLRKICDEIFGEKNFVAEFIWNSKQGTVGTSENISKNHEYIICYAKNIINLNFAKITKYCNERKENLRQWGQADRRVDRPSMFYPIKIDGIEIFPIKEDGSEGRWRVGKETAIELLKNNELLYEFKNNRYNIYRIYKEKYTFTPYSTLLSNIETTALGTKTLKQLFNQYIFDYSKPTALIDFFLKLIDDKTSIILDFFSGSATTAHAVMQLNAEDGGNRKYIMVQLPAETPEDSEARKAGYNTICEIGKERIRRAGEKIKKDYPNANIDTGFRVFKLDSSNMEDVYYEAEKFSQQDISKTISYIKAERSEEDLLFQIILSCGIPLKCKIEIKKVNNRDVYFVDNTYLLVCFEKDIDDKTIEELAKMQPDFMVFNQNVQDSTLANIKQIFKMISNDTNVKVI